MNLSNQQTVSTVLAPPDRRRHPRHSVQVQIELRQEGSDVPMRMNTTDLSRGGCYVELMMTMPVGTYLNISVWLNDRSIRVRGRVVTRHPQFGNGIMFVEFHDHGESDLVQYLAALSVSPC